MVKSKSSIRDGGLRAVVAIAGSRYQLAKAIGIRLPAVMRWKKVPSHRVIQLETLYGIDRERLRPDLYPPRDKVRK